MRFPLRGRSLRKPAEPSRRERLGDRFDLSAASLFNVAMRRWFFAVAVLAVAAASVVLWRAARPRETRVAVSSRSDAGPAHAEPAQPRNAPREPGPVVPVRDAGAPDARLGILAADSEAFSKRLDVDIPARLRASVARCDRTGHALDEVLKVSFLLRIQSGEVSTSDVRVVESTLGDAALEQCMLHSILDSRFRVEDLPDFQEEHELFIRLRTLGKYRTPEEQDRATEERQRQRESARDDGE